MEKRTINRNKMITLVDNGVYMDASPNGNVKIAMELKNGSLIMDTDGFTENNRYSVLVSLSKKRLKDGYNATANPCQIGSIVVYGRYHFSLSKFPMEREMLLDSKLEYTWKSGYGAKHLFAYKDNEQIEFESGNIYNKVANFMNSFAAEDMELFEKKCKRNNATGCSIPVMYLDSGSSCDCRVDIARRLFSSMAEFIVENDIKNLSESKSARLLKHAISACEIICPEWD